MSRPRIPAETETRVLVRSRRRCALCFGLHRDSSVKQGQIAHLDRDCSNNKIDNLAFLCLDHHDQYDSRTSQSKGFGNREAKCHRAELEEALQASFSAPIEVRKNDPCTQKWEGIYRWERDNASAELQIVRSAPNRYSVSGLALWGIHTLEAPHNGMVDSGAMLDGDYLVLGDHDYELSMVLTDSGLSAAEKAPVMGPFGMNVTFEGQYRRVPTGSGALPQPEMRPFESEFWPEGGSPSL